MKKVDQILLNAILQLEQTSEIEKLAQQTVGDDKDITKPSPDGDQAPPEGAPAPLTSKGEEYLLKLAYLALLYTPKEEEMIQIKNTFESSGIHDETSIQAENPQTIEDTKNILVNILGMNNNTSVENQLNQIPQND
jgi:hypothetical protein